MSHFTPQGAAFLSFRLKHCRQRAEPRRCVTDRPAPLTAAVILGRGAAAATPAPPRRASRPRKMAAAGRAWRFAALLPPWRLRAPCRSLCGAARGAAAAAGGGRLLLGAAFALGGGAGLCLAARQRLREHSAAEVTRRRARREKGRPGRRGAGLPSPWSARLPVARFRLRNGLK